MILDIPYVYWARAEFRGRQNSILRVKDTTPVLIQPAGRVTPLHSLHHDGVQYDWFIDEEGLILRRLLDENGKPSSASDIEAADPDQLFGHHAWRKWWRDHPASFDLALNPDTSLAWSVRSVGGFFSIGNATRHSEVFIREDTIATINKRAELMCHDGDILYVRAPLPGYVVESVEGRVWLNHWIPPLHDGNASIRAYFSHGEFYAAREAALSLAPDAAILAHPVELPDTPYPPPFGDWSPLGATLIAIVTSMTRMTSEGSMSLDHEQYSIAMGTLGLGWTEKYARVISDCAAAAGYPEELIRMIVAAADRQSSDEDIDWDLVDAFSSLWR